MMLKSLVLSALLAVAGTAVAAEIVLFEYENFGGGRLPAAESLPNLADAQFNDRAGSVRIRSGEWQLCTDAYFGGSCVTLGPGDYPSMAALGLASSLSSARILSDGEPGSLRAGGGRGARRDVVLYDYPNFGGEAFRVPDTMPNLDGTGFNDRAASMIVYDGTWEACEDADFGGACLTFGPGRYPNLGRLDDRVSSLRPARGAGGGGLPGGTWGSGSRALLYEGTDLAGRLFVVDRYLANLDGTGFNDRARSLRIERGYWMFCSDADFQGDCRTFGPGDYPQLPRGLNSRISSGRRISDDYPYRTSPNWGQ